VEREMESNDIIVQPVIISLKIKDVIEPIGIKYYGKNTLRESKPMML